MNLLHEVDQTGYCFDAIVYQVDDQFGYALRCVFVEDGQFQQSHCDGFMIQLKPYKTFNNIDNFEYKRFIVLLLHIIKMCFRFAFPISKFSGTLFASIMKYKSLHESIKESEMLKKNVFE